MAPKAISPWPSARRVSLAGADEAEETPPPQVGLDDPPPANGATIGAPAHVIAMSFGSRMRLRAFESGLVDEEPAGAAAGDLARRQVLRAPGAMGTSRHVGMAPPSQGAEPPANPGRFNLIRALPKS
jgi:hypothetical protein